MLDKKDYIVKQLHRTNNKKFESYVINRIWNLINDLDIKIITQQYIVRPDGFALADLYFPQFNLIVEVDEAYHLGNKINDEIRESDIINASDFDIYRIDTSKSIEDIHKQIDNFVKIINILKENGFEKWDYESEFDNRKYIDKGYIDVSDNAVFRTQKDVYNCFGFNYENNVQRCCINHKYIGNVSIWNPKLYPHGEWTNEISLDESTIYEVNNDEKKNNRKVKMQLVHPRDVRYVFAQSKDNLGRVLYRFKGEYTLDKEETKVLQKVVWKRTSNRVKTINKN